MPVTLLLTITGDEADEAAYHEMFAADRANLEWFRLSLDLREFLSSMFEAGTHELLTDVEFECHEHLMDSAAFTTKMRAMIARNARSEPVN